MPEALLNERVVMRLFLFFISIGLIAGSCRKDEPETVPTNSYTLKGKFIGVYDASGTTITISDNNDCDSCVHISGLYADDTLSAYVHDPQMIIPEQVLQMTGYSLRIGGTAVFYNDYEPPTAGAPDQMKIELHEETKQDTETTYTFLQHQTVYLVRL
jgi:hypothetical protein